MQLKIDHNFTGPVFGRTRCDRLVDLLYVSGECVTRLSADSREYPAGVIVTPAEVAALALTVEPYEPRNGHARNCTCPEANNY